MKKILLIFVTLILSMAVLVSCDGLANLMGGENSGNDSGDHTHNNEKEPDNKDPDNDENTPDDGVNEPDDGENEPDNGENEPGGDNKPSDEKKHTYVDFTASEKKLLSETFGFIIPFAPNEEYYVEEYRLDYDDCYEEGINFYTYGNTEDEFESYRKLFSVYYNDGSEADEYGDVWYFYSFGDDYYIDLSYYLTEGEYVIDVYVYAYYDYGGENPGGDSGNQGDTGSISHTYTDFTSDEKAMFVEAFGSVIPFAPNDEYYIEDYYYDYGDGEYDEGLNFYAYGLTSAEFEAYKALFSDYYYDGSEADEYGDTWYFYTADEGFYVDLAYYLYEDEYIVDVYCYFIYEEGSGDSGNQGGSDSGSITPDSLITNEGVGLPQGTNGIYNIDFTDATYVKDVTEQGYYLDGCPTTGSPAVLVIPVDFSDINGRNNGYSIDNIVRAFNGGDGETDYYSVHDYYYISSWGALDLDITVLDEWFVPKYSSDYYANATIDYYGEEVSAGEQLIMDEALSYLAGVMDLSKFDSDGNGVIDAVVMINTLTVDDSTDFYWAFRYWNLYTDSDDYYYEYDGVSANDYMWASYSFMHESYDDSGYSNYSDTSVMNTYTFIHEFGHVLGADDYYDTADVLHPMDGCDVMDSMPGDHCAFTKFNLGWIKNSRLVTADSDITLTLERFSESGDTIIIANNWNPELGAYQEYYVVVYYTNDGLNGNGYGYFARDGVVVYHVNASLYGEEYDGETYYDIYNNNTHSSDEYGTDDNLIELVKSDKGNYTYVSGDSLPAKITDLGEELIYSFTVDSIDGDYATITFKRG